MPYSAAHKYAREGNIDALSEYTSSSPDATSSRGGVSILLYICNYMIYHQY